MRVLYVVVMLAFVGCGSTGEPTADGGAGLGGGRATGGGKATGGGAAATGGGAAATGGGAAATGGGAAATGGGAAATGGGAAATGGGAAATGGGAAATGGGAAATGGGSAFVAGSLFVDPTTMGSNAHEPAIAVDAAGVTHLLYSGFTPNVLNVHPIRYGRCAANCEQPASWNWLTLADTGIAGGSGHLVVGGDGHLHAVWVEESAIDATATLHYGTCASACLSLGSWQTGTILTATAPNVSKPVPLAGHSLTVDSQGHPRLVLRRDTYAPVGTFVALCDAATCLTESNWTLAKLDADSPFSGELVAVGSGLRLLSNPRNTLNWRECQSNCGTVGNWAGTDLFFAQAPHLALALDAQSRPRALFNLGSLGEAVNQHFTFYGWCDSGCTDVTNWKNSKLPTLVSGDGEEGLSLVLDSTGAPGLAYTTLTGLGVGGCVSGCNTATSTWTLQEIETTADITPAPLKPSCTGTALPQAWWFPGRSVQGALDAAGNLHLIHETYTLQKCGAGSVSESVRLPRYRQL